MDTAILFPDAQLAVRDLLRRLLASRSEVYATGATVSTKGKPGDDTAPKLPYIQVRTDGTFRDSRLDGRSTVRVLVHHRDEGFGLKLAALCEALLLASSSQEVRGITSLAGPIPVGDSETGDPFSFFTITARLRPVQL